jgi:hypothetical protein
MCNNIIMIRMLVICCCPAEAEALLASLDPQEREAVLAALAKKKRKAEKAARLEQAEVSLAQVLSCAVTCHCRAQT